MSDQRDHSDALLEMMLEVHFSSSAESDVSQQVIERIQQRLDHEDRLLVAMINEVTNEDHLPDQTASVLQRVQKLEQGSNPIQAVRRKAKRRNNRRTKQSLPLVPIMTAAAALIVWVLFWLAQDSTPRHVPQEKAKDLVEAPAPKRVVPPKQEPQEHEHRHTPVENELVHQENETEDQGEDVVAEHRNISESNKAIEQPEEQQTDEHIAQQAEPTDEEQVERRQQLELPSLGLQLQAEIVYGDAYVRADKKKTSIYEQQAIETGTVLETGRGFAKFSVKDTHVYLYDNTQCTFSEMEINNKLVPCLVLNKGEVFIEDHYVRIAVLTKHALVQPIGTSYSVKHGASTLSSVIEGRVDIRNQMKESDEPEQGLKRVRFQSFKWKDDLISVDAGLACTSKKTSSVRSLKKAQIDRIKSWTAIIDEARNRLVNGNFERGTDPWILLPGIAQFELVQAASPSGSHHMHVTMAPVQGGLDAGKIFADQIDVQPGEEYLYSVLLKTGRLDAQGVQLEVTYTDDQDKTFNSTNLSLAQKSNQAWRRVEKRITIPPKTFKLGLYFRLMAHKSQPTECWLDQMTLMKIRQ